MNTNLVVLVTGATRGIGYAVTMNYLKQGARVIGIYKSSTEKAKKMAEKHANLSMYQVDLGNPKAVTKFVNELPTKTDHIDILVNNAGIYTSGSLKTLNTADFQYNFMVNVIGKFALTQQLLPLLLKSAAPKVINVSSRFGFVGNADPDSLAYNIANSAIIMMTAAMQKEFAATNVKFGCYIPTVTNTDRFKQAFTTEEKTAIAKSGMLAQADETAQKIDTYAQALTGNEIMIDRRVSTEHLGCMNLQTM